MGIELELAELLIIQLLASSFFARFEVETLPLKRILKWLIIYGITIGLYFAFHHWAVIFPIFPMIFGAIFHFNWCRKHGINPFNATPRKKYYQLRGWKWEE
ncbi:MAG: hypothetical protein ACI7YS_07080 [Flavobacterium sp.]